MQYNKEDMEMLLQHNSYAGGLFTECKKGTWGERVQKGEFQGNLPAFEFALDILRQSLVVLLLMHFFSAIFCFVFKIHLVFVIFSKCQIVCIKFYMCSHPIRVKTTIIVASLFHLKLVLN